MTSARRPPELPHKLGATRRAFQVDTAQLYKPAKFILQDEVCAEMQAGRAGGAGIAPPHPAGGRPGRMRPAPDGLRIPIRTPPELPHKLAAMPRAFQVDTAQLYKPVKFILQDEVCAEMQG
jgi:hypothetical protein